MAPTKEQIKTAKAFAAMFAMRLTDKQHKVFVAKLAELLAAESEAMLDKIFENHAGASL